MATPLLSLPLLMIADTPGRNIRFRAAISVRRTGGHNSALGINRLYTAVMAKKDVEIQRLEN